MARSLRLPALVFAGWTLFVWGQRVVNIVRDDELSAGGRVGRLALAGVLVALAVVVAVSVLRPSGSPHRAVVAVRTLAVVTVGVWAWRAVDIVAGDWSVGFVVVHLVLAAISIALAVWAWRATTGLAASSPSIPARSS